MSEHLEHVLSQLLVPDNAVIQQATQQIKELLKDPASIPALCLTLGASQNPQVRQYAALLLRRRILKKKQWKSVSPDVAVSIRQNLLQVLLQEPEKSVRKSLAQLVATVAKHDLPEGKWPELFQFLQEHTRSQIVEQREVGMDVLATTASVAYEQLQPHIMELLQLCSVTMQDQGSVLVPFYTVRTLTHLAPMAGTNEVKAFQQLVPGIMTVIKQLMSVDEEKATEAMEILDELVECEVPIITPHVRGIIEFCMEVAANKALTDPLRVKALSFVSWLTRLKNKTILKYKLIQPILGVLFPILCEEQDDDDDDEDCEGAEASSPTSFAAQVVDVMALHLPPEKLIPALMKHVDSALIHEDQFHRKAAYISMAVVAEGCADHLRTRHLKNLLQCVYKGLSDPSPIVRNASLFALGQFSEHLQPDISKFSSELLPILFDCLGKAGQDIDKDPRGVTKVHYALEMFVENLEKEILPYLPQLMQYLMNAVVNSPNKRAQELAISSISAVANAAKDEFLPYFPQVIEILKGFLSPTKEESELKVQIQALECLGVFARTMEKLVQPMAVECVKLGLSLMADATDPDLRRCIYGLFASLSVILKAEMGQFMEPMVKQMIECVKSTEGVTAHYAEEESQMFKVFDEEENIEGEEDEDDESVQGFSVENAYLDEKEDACQSLGDLALHTGVSFMPYLEESYKEVMNLLEYPAPTVRKSGVVAVASMCICVSNVAAENQVADAQAAMVAMLGATVPRILTMIREDSDRQVSTIAIDSFNEMLKNIKAPVVQVAGPPETIPNLIRDVLNKKIACQDQDEADEEEDEEAEYDTVLVENAGELMPSMAKAVGGAEFAPYVASLLPEILKRLKPSSTVAERSFAVGTLGDTMNALGPASASFVNTLYPIFLGCTQDADEEVRSNAVFSVGALAANGGDAMFSKYPNILRSLFDILNKEKDKRVIDNVCAAVCRMIMANIAGVPMDQVFPTVIKCLPLKEDLEENDTVVKCMAHLYGSNHQELINHLPQVLSNFGQVLGLEEVKESEETIVAMVKDVAQRFPDIYSNTVTSLPADQSAKLQHCLEVLSNGCNGCC